MINFNGTHFPPNESTVPRQMSATLFLFSFFFVQKWKNGKFIQMNLHFALVWTVKSKFRQKTKYRCRSRATEFRPIFSQQFGSLFTKHI